MGKYIVHEPLRHDGEDYAIGGTVDLDAKTADGLLVSGVVIDQATAKAKAKAAQEAEQAAQEAEQA